MKSFKNVFSNNAVKYNGAQLNMKHMLNIIKEILLLCH
jgi:hypothetical protein